MFDDIKELIDQAASQPNQTHRDELWQQFQHDAQGTTPTVSRPTIVLRPPALEPVPSETIILEKVEPADELTKRRNHRRIYGALAVAAAVVTIAGIAAVSRNGKTLQVAPGADPTSTAMTNGDMTSRAPLVPRPTEVPTTVASSAAGTTAVTYAPTTVPATTIAPATTRPGTTPPATTVPKPGTTVGVPATKLVTVAVPNYSREFLTAIGGWDGTSFVALPNKVAPGPYQSLAGEKFDVDIAKPDAAGEVHLTPSTVPDGIGISFSGTSWSAQPRAARSQGDVGALKDARFNIYREEASRLAKEIGGANVMPVLSSVVRVDLDGDGTDEVLVAASYIRYDTPQQGPDPATVGSFSIAFVRHVAGDSATSKVLSVVVAKDSARIVPELVIEGAADLNGDGVMEVLGWGGQWESASFYCWNAGTVDGTPKVLFSVPAYE
jgi:hypothetical protein